MSINYTKGKKHYVYLLLVVLVSTFFSNSSSNYVKAQPDLIYPLNYSKITDNTPTFQWQHISAFFDEFEIQIARDYGFTDVVIQEIVIYDKGTIMLKNFYDFEGNLEKTIGKLCAK